MKNGSRVVIISATILVLIAAFAIFRVTLSSQNIARIPNTGNLLVTGTFFQSANTVVLQVQPAEGEQFKIPHLLILESKPKDQLNLTKIGTTEEIQYYKMLEGYLAAKLRDPNTPEPEMPAYWKTLFLIRAGDSGKLDSGGLADNDFTAMPMGGKIVDYHGKNVDLIWFKKVLPNVLSQAAQKPVPFGVQNLRDAQLKDVEGIDWEAMKQDPEFKYYANFNPMKPTFRVYRCSNLGNPFPTAGQ